MKNIFQSIKFVFLVGSIVFLSACDPIGNIKRWLGFSTQGLLSRNVKPEVHGVPLYIINGVPVIGSEDLEKSVGQMLRANQYFRGLDVGSIPMAIKDKILREEGNQYVIERYCVDVKHIEDNPKFQNDFAETMALVKRNLICQSFENDILEKIVVSDEEVMKYYHENKEKKFVKVPGGVLVDGVQFASESQALVFLDKVKQHPSKFEQMGKAEKNATLKSFGRINLEVPSGGMMYGGGAIVPAQIRELALSKKEFPSIDKVVVGKDVWVVAAQNKQDSVYYAEAEVSPRIREYLKEGKFRSTLAQEIDRLKSSMVVTINEDYFKEAAKRQQQQQQMVANQPGGEVSGAADNSKPNAQQVAGEEEAKKSDSVQHEGDVVASEPNVEGGKEVVSTTNKVVEQEMNSNAEGLASAA